MQNLETSFSSKYARIVIPYKTKLVEKITLLPFHEREAILKKVGYNLMKMSSDQVYMDFISDSGTGAMSTEQFALTVTADQAYFNTPSYYRLQKTVQNILGFPHVIPVHQGRGAQHIFDFVLLKQKSIVVGNTPFVVVAIAIELQGGKFLDCIVEHSNNDVFNGNIDIARLVKLVNENASNISYIMITVQATGRPISMKNIREVSRIAKENKILFCCDAARFTSNAYYIQKYEEGYSNMSIRDISKEMMSYFDTCLMSGKKDAIVPCGGFIAVRDDALAAQLKVPLVAFEGYDTYGGMTAGGMDAMAQGLLESAQDEDCTHRNEQVHRFAALLKEFNIPIIEPAFSHMIKIDAQKFFPNVPVEQYPSYLLCAELYKEGGIRCTPHRDESKKLDLCYFSVPWRTYSFEHFEYVADVIKTVLEKKGNVKTGLRLVSEKNNLFDAQFFYV